MGITSNFSETDNVLTITVDGRFDFSALQAFRNAYEKIEPKPKAYVVDLKGSDYLDSSALGMLLNMQKSMQEQVERFSIVNACPKVAKILQISRFDKKFNIN